MILQTPDGVFVGDEIDIATQLLDRLVLPIDKRRLQHLAAALKSKSHGEEPQSTQSGTEESLFLRSGCKKTFITLSCLS